MNEPIGYSDPNGQYVLAIGVTCLCVAAIVAAGIGLKGCDSLHKDVQGNGLDNIEKAVDKAMNPEYNGDASIGKQWLNTISNNNDPMKDMIQIPGTPLSGEISIPTAPYMAAQTVGSWIDSTFRWINQTFLGAMRSQPTNR